MKDRKVIFILSIFFIIIVLGFFQVSNATSNFIKKNSVFKVYMNKNPLDIKIELAKYTFQLNKEIVVNTKEKIINSTIVDKIKESEKINNINKEIILVFNNNVLKINKALRLMNNSYSLFIINYSLQCIDILP
ncbi:hypothetical protein [Clostridium cochlearium]|uniref:Uncharacterized protein n=1 Tax=Clostridium cochlearium TaxID=1494 RepID=A0ABY0QJG9_CLOCO|nr:hypothetical protein [Clostridium cochlearium]MBV1819752.1 hypothetical protein [Bacteroidales bacterium MSK.15.36]NSJ91478.1 hypothetical protein [Coprococcus sp. MSK.21.13]MCG4571723.1 hypothetical protein [Clostridium cochlearium]MCG4578646.1 hypothetical protein [Clostridium cochlearium]MCR1971593.1 hypothetical protein [Clostridium cochlearium]